MHGDNDIEWLNDSVWTVHMVKTILLKEKDLSPGHNHSVFSSNSHGKARISPLNGYTLNHYASLTNHKTSSLSNRIRTPIL